MREVLTRLGIEAENAGAFDGEWRGSGKVFEKRSPVDGSVLARVREASREDYDRVVARAQEAFLKWRTTPAPVRGETVQDRRCPAQGKPELGKLVTMEMGKIIAEGEGEVQEMIDICDFRRRPIADALRSHDPIRTAEPRLMEQWQSLGIVAVISAFNFPVAVWSWNAALAAVCGDPTIWKPSEKTPLTAIAVTKIAQQVCKNTGADPAIFSLLIGDRHSVGEPLAADRRIPLVSATGSTTMGIAVSKSVHGRLAKAFSNSAATTRSSFRKVRTWTWRRVPFSSARSARRDSAVLRRGASLRMNRSLTGSAISSCARTSRCASGIRSTARRPSARWWMPMRSMPCRNRSRR
jgi:aldehyde dehydrogenase (NAD+)